MNLIPEPLERLTAEFARLPGIGPKTAQRLTFHCMEADPEDVARLGAALQALRGAVRDCAVCGFISQAELCAICSNSSRDQTQACVTETSLDVLAIERSGEFHGVYHVLGGALSPIEGIGPAQLHIDSLITRIGKGVIKEVILATDPDVEGEATAHYLADRLGAYGVAVTRLAHGLPAGADLQYADELTVARAFIGRRQL